MIGCVGRLYDMQPWSDFVVVQHKSNVFISICKSMFCIVPELGDSSLTLCSVSQCMEWIPNIKQNDQNKTRDVLC